jgi:hypothetical protein
MSMHWFRWNQRRTTYVALLALALQLVISFGHVHLNNLALGKITTAAAQTVSESGTPAGTIPDRDEGCAICAIIGLAGTPLLPDAPPLLVADAQHATLLPDLIAVLASDHTRAQFQARAPPA